MLISLLAVQAVNLRDRMLDRLAKCAKVGALQNVAQRFHSIFAG